jgi:hypothetical protein
LVQIVGADATLNHRIPLEEQLKEIEAVTGGNFSRVFDASAMATETGMKALASISKSTPKYFTTTNDWYVNQIHIQAILVAPWKISLCVQGAN